MARVASLPFTRLLLPSFLPSSPSLPTITFPLIKLQPLPLANPCPFSLHLLFRFSLAREVLVYLLAACLVRDELTFSIPGEINYNQEMDVQYHEEYVTNPRDVQLFTCGWLPASSSPKALVFLCHGYGMECSDFMKACGITLATAGYGVFGIDYEGHGKSMGARCYIQKFDHLVTDCDCFFKSICDMEEFRGKSRFLYGESMGGAVTLLLHRKDPTFWDGAVLVAPMCKISEKVKPHPVVITLLTKVEELIPTWKIVPTKDVIDSAFKDPVKRDEIRKNKLIYQDKPRLKTALEMLRTSMDVEDSLSEVKMPFFVLHGEADTVTDPEVSRVLYENATSNDKTIKLYPEMWHGLTAGEPDKNVELVFADIVAWLDERSGHRNHEDEQVRAPPDSNGYQWTSFRKMTHVDSSNEMDSPVSIQGSQPQPPQRRESFVHQQCRM